MNKRVLVLLIVLNVIIITIAGLGLFFTGCQTATNTVTTTTTASATTSTIQVGSTFTLSGSLKAGTITSAGLRAAGVKAQASAGLPLEDHNIIAVDSDGNITFADAKTGSDGSFTISNLPKGKQFYLNLINDLGQFIAPIAFASDNNQVIMAISPEVDFGLGDISYDSSKQSACPTEQPTSGLSNREEHMVPPQSGEILVPIGGPSKGGDESAESYDPDQPDGDKDGLVDYFDKDNNGDGSYDEFDQQYSKDAVNLTTDSNIDRIYVFSNLKIEFSNTETYKPDYRELSIAFGVQPKAGSTITRTYITESPTWLASAQIIGGTTLWSSTSPPYSLSQQSATLWETQIHGVRPSIEVKSGDFFKFVTEFTDGTSEESVKMLNFVFTDIPKVYQYKFGSTSSWITAPAYSGSFNAATTSDVYVKWSRPKDDDGQEIQGGRYTFEYSPTQTIAAAEETTIISQDANVTPYCEGNFDFSPVLGSTASTDGFMVGICIRSTANDNAAQNLHFTTQGW